MKYIIKRNVDLFGKNNIIKFGYNAKLNNSKNGLENFDIGNEEILIDNLLKKIDDKIIKDLNKINPIYISLSNYLFTNLPKLYSLEYETNDIVAKIKRQELIDI